jgi:uncharacterized phage-associated protein
MTASAHDVAAAIRRRLPEVVPTKKLHKMLYHCQGYHLAWFSTPLFTEVIEAWRMGPVVADLWKDEKYDYPPEEFAELSETELNTIGYVCSRYGKNSGAELEHITHNEGPWRQAFRRSRIRPGRDVISRESIREFFVAKLAAEQTGPQVDPDELRNVLAGALDRLAEPAMADNADSLRALVRG